MSRFRSVSVSTLLTLALATVMGSVLAGGCPQAQTPGQVPEPNDNEDFEPNQAPGQAPGRPIPPPIVEPPVDANVPETLPDPNLGTGGVPTGYQIRAAEPLSAITVRPPTKVNASFRVTDPDRQITAAALLLARDADGNGAPDAGALTQTPVSVTPGTVNLSFDTSTAQSLLSNGYGRFLLGLRIETKDGKVTEVYAPGTLTIDSTAPTARWVSPEGDRLVSPQKWPVELETSDNSPHTVTIQLDADTNPNNGFSALLVPKTPIAAGKRVTRFEPPLSVSAGIYYYVVILSDGVQPPVYYYAPNLEKGGAAKAQIFVTNRLVGDYDLNRLDPDQVDKYDNDGPKSQGTILQGFNFNDLAGTAMESVPDVNDDGTDELVIAARFGKPRVNAQQGTGWGEAYFVYGQTGARLRDPLRLNQIGDIADPNARAKGVTFTGIRVPVGQSWTEGLSDVTAVPDMDGDGRPELVFGFPRAESVSLGNNQWQYQSMYPYALGMGHLEYDPIHDIADSEIIDPNDPNKFLIRRSDFLVPNSGGWLKNRAQFTRGGIVIVSSSNVMLKDPSRLNRKGDRIIDLHESGQCFEDPSRVGHMGRDRLWPIPEPFAIEPRDANCPDPNDPNVRKPKPYGFVKMLWNLTYEAQGPGSFYTWPFRREMTSADNPPLANMWPSGWTLGLINERARPVSGPLCEDPNCSLTNFWYPGDPNQKGDKCAWLPRRTFGSLYYPPGVDPNKDAGLFLYTGFSGYLSPHLAPWPETVGARVLGQRVGSRFGTSVAADSVWLYISAPGQTAFRADEPRLTSDRSRSGVVYQYRHFSPRQLGEPTRSQLWIEPATIQISDPNANDPNVLIDYRLRWPYPDLERMEQDSSGRYVLPGSHDDYSMPLPHTYIIRDTGSERSNDRFWALEWERIFPGGDPVYDPNARQIEWPIEEFAPDGACGKEAIVKKTQQAAIRAFARCESDLWRGGGGGIGHSTYFIERVQLIIGPHEDAEISTVQYVGDIDFDGVDDFAVGSRNIKENIRDGNGPAVGAVFVVFGRNPGLEGSYLLEDLARDPNDASRLAGVVLKGNSNGADRIARVFSRAGRFNGDDFNDVVIGNETGAEGRGEAIVLFGSPYLRSPAGGWTVTEALDQGVAMRFIGEEVGDAAGANVAYAGDVDGDGFGDILVAAPGARGSRGVVYLIYGSPVLFAGGQSIPLSKIGTFDLPGVRLIGRAPGDALGGGRLVFGDNDPNNPNGSTYLAPDPVATPIYPEGLASLGDLDGDGKDDFAVSAVLADPFNRRDAGEVYVLYGRGD